METIACLLGGAALLFSGIGLSRLRAPDWTMGHDTAADAKRIIARWAKFQRSVRTLNNGLLMTIGIIMSASGFVPHGNLWVAMWFLILLILLVCIFLAFLDALSSLAGYREAIPEAARRSFGRPPQ
jgi:hypothetical protein